MRVLILGGGGREHALAWKIAASPLLQKLYISPGNPGTAELGENIAGDILDPKAVLKLVQTLGIDLMVIGPEACLAAGVTDAVRAGAPGCRVLGPHRAGARLEWSKAYAKDFMNKYGIPTARHLVFSDRAAAADYLADCPLPVVVKADGLAAGKGVVVARTRTEALAARSIPPLEQPMVVEEFLSGREVSVLALTDGRRYHLLPPVRDYKALEDGDRGPNTGGMGAYSPVPGIGKDELAAIDSIAAKTLRGLLREGVEYRGIIYLGLMITGEGVKLLEYNARFGDPECQVLMSQLESDLLLYLSQAANGMLPEDPPEWSTDSACLVVACGGDYPHLPSFGLPITGIEQARAAGCLVFQAGTALIDGQLVTGGGRVLNVLGRGAGMEHARHQAYQGFAAIAFPNMRFRTDIGEGVVL